MHWQDNKRDSLGEVSYDQGSYKLATLATETFGRLGKERSDLIAQAAANIVGGTPIAERRLQGPPVPDNLQ